MFRRGGMCCSIFTIVGQGSRDQLYTAISCEQKMVLEDVKEQGGETTYVSTFQFFVYRIGI